MGNIDAIAAPSEAKGLFNHQSLPIGPSQRYIKHVLIAQLIPVGLSLELSVLVSFWTVAKCIQAGLDQSKIHPIGVKQPYQIVRLVFRHRVVHQARSLQCPPLGADLNIQYIRQDVDRVVCRCGIVGTGIYQGWHLISHDGRIYRTGR